jgi:hypothetical protein
MSTCAERYFNLFKLEIINVAKENYLNKFEPLKTTPLEYFKKCLTMYITKLWQTIFEMKNIKSMLPPTRKKVAFDFFHLEESDSWKRH